MENRMETREISGKNAIFIGYEYRDITIDRDMESMYVDGYQNFGWALEKATAPQLGLTMVTLKFKRDRKIRNKMELTRLQRQFDACVAEVVAMEGSRETSASILAFTVGLVGTAFMAGSVFAVVAEPPKVALCVILAIPALVGWVLPWFLYKARYAKRAAQLAPLIDGKYDEIYEVCQRASDLLGH